MGLASVQVQQRVDVQAALDAQAYPPTHTYLLDSLRPTDVLAERMALFDELVPGFFCSGRHFLDVGCNKGFFSLLAARAGLRVLGVDIDAHCIQLCQRARDHLALDHAHFEVGGLLSVDDRQRFDRVLIGNAHHYLFREVGGSFEWVDQLASIATDQLLIEGPIGMECFDMEAAIPPSMRSGFHPAAFFEAMTRHFVLRRLVPTVSYTPDRYLMHFERRETAGAR